MTDYGFIIDAPDGWSEYWQPTGQTSNGIPTYELAQRIEPLSHHPAWKHETDWDAELAKLIDLE